MNDDTLSWLEAHTLAVFGNDGPLAAGQADYHPRQGQKAMAGAVARCIESNGRLVVEAGTGVGKTFAYLVPALLSGRRVLVSTATKALQDQLFGRDLPVVARTLGLPLRTALLKGRSSYLCMHRLGQAWQRVPGGNRYLSEQLREIETWATCTVSGDVAEVRGLDEHSELLPWVTSTRENCLGSGCPQFQGCHVQAARRQALAADVVVVNHHLLFADRDVRESGMAELLPTTDVIVVDEAHRLLDTGVQFLGVSIGTTQWLDLARDARVLGQREARGLQDWEDCAAAVEQAVQGMRRLLGPASGRLGWLGRVPEGVALDAWRATTEVLEQALAGLDHALLAVTGHSAELDRLHARLTDLCSRWEQVQPPADEADAQARWLDCGAGIRFVAAPLDLRQTFGADWVGTGTDTGKAWVFTSATLGTDDALRWFTEPLGLDDASTLCVTSPFDYPHQAGIYVLQDLPDPLGHAHSTALAGTIWPWIERLGGRTLVLTTTLRALEAVGQALEHLSHQSLGPQVLVQGHAAKTELLERFRRAGSGQGGGAVLVASASFWEGVDLPGDCLQLVVIDKLPFPPPNDPWVQAHVAALEAVGKRAFPAYFLPEAAVALKQGAGRLIRRETDRGLLVIGDPRLAKRPYGRRLLAALPPMRVLQQGAQVDQWLDELVTTASTRDLPWS